MRKREVKERKVLVETSVICDDCGKECKNTNVEVMFQHSFCDKVDHYKDLCYSCWEKKYKSKAIEQRNKDSDELLKAHKDD